VDIPWIRLRRGRPSTKAQNTVEFTLSIFLFISILFVGIQMGLIIIQQYALMHVTRESARWLATHYDTDQAPLVAHVKGEAARMVTLRPNNFDSIVAEPACVWVVDRCTGRAGVQQIKLTTTYNLATHTFLSPAMLSAFGISTTARNYAVAMQQESP